MACGRHGDDIDGFSAVGLFAQANLLAASYRPFAASAIHQDDVEDRCGWRFDGFEAVPNDLGGVTELAQLGHGHLLVDDIVLRQQMRRLGRGGRGRGGLSWAEPFFFGGLRSCQTFV